MKHFFAVVVFAIIAGLVAVEVASEKGVRGLSETVRHALGLPEGRAVVANFKSVGIEGADVRAKVAELTEKAIEAAQPDRSKSVTPQPEDQAAERAEPQPEPAPDTTAEQAAAPEAVPQEPTATAEAPSTEAPPAEAPPPPATADGVTHFYGSSDGTAVAAWAGAATMNPDYEPADATGAGADVTSQVSDVPPETAPQPEAAPTEESVVAAETPAEPSAESEVPAPAAAPAAEPDAPAPAAEAQVEPESAPAPTGGDGVTSYYGLASKPDADQAWAAAAAPNPDYTPGADAAEAPASEPAASEPAAAEAPAAATEPQAAAREEPAPAPTGGEGQTSYFGFAKMPDEDQPWAAAATMNPDYTAADAPAVEPQTEQAAAPEPAADTPAAVSEPAAAPSEEPAPAPTGEKGVSSYYGVAEKADATQPWAAAAAPNPDYTAVVASPPEVTPATQEAVEACRDALNAEAQAGGLTFAIQRWDVTPENYRSLDKLAKVAKDCGGVIIEVRGHTDNTGRPASNKTLSDLRAKAVITYLTKAGVPLSKLKAMGFGEDKPVGDNATVKGRAQNRRIEFVVTGG